MMIAQEPRVVKKKPGYPKGWRFMKEFVHVDGTVYHRGVEQPNLKGKKKPTEIVVKPKLTKKQKARHDRKQAKKDLKEGNW